VESNQIDVVAAPVFRDREEVDHVFETRTSRQVWRDVGQTDHPNRIHFDLALVHAVASANLDVGTRPYSDTASDSASSHSVSEPLGEDHAASLRLSGQLREERIRRVPVCPTPAFQPQRLMIALAADGCKRALGLRASPVSDHASAFAKVIESSFQMSRGSAAARANIHRRTRSLSTSRKSAKRRIAASGAVSIRPLQLKRCCVAS
jgi:hypothetical protein